MSPLHAIAFAIGLLVGAATSGCGTLPSRAYLVMPDELEAVHDAWASSGQPPCFPLPTLWVYEATPAERSEWCHATPPPAACLATPRTSMMHEVFMAVVSPEYPQGWKHEAFHMFEACTAGSYDYGHAGPQWGDGVRSDAGIP